MSSCILWYEVGDTEMSFISEKRGSCAGLDSGSDRSPLRVVDGRFFLNPMPASKFFFDGGTGFVFEGTVAFWKIRCLVLRVLPLATLRDSISISFIFG